MPQPLDAEARAEALSPYQCPLRELNTRARELLDGRLPRGSEGIERLVLDEWLRWSQSASTEALMHWTYLRSSGEIPDRDDYVLRLWRSIAAEGGANHWLHRQIVDHVAPWEFYERHFFSWFLSRFNLPAARLVLRDSRVLASLHWAFVVVAVLAAVVTLLMVGRGLSSGAFAVAIVLLVMAGGLLLPLPPYGYVHSLIPRLAAAVAIGYLFLASAPHLIGAIDRSWRSPCELWLAAGLLVFAAMGYIILHISRRVRPSPPAAAVVKRSATVLGLAIGYASLGILLAAPILFSKAFLCAPGEECLIDAGPEKLALCAAIALNLGVILQLAWDEKPLTEPL